MGDLVDMLNADANKNAIHSNNEENVIEESLQPPQNGVEDEKEAIIEAIIENVANIEGDMNLNLMDTDAPDSGDDTGDRKIAPTPPANSNDAEQSVTSLENDISGDNQPQLENTLHIDLVSESTPVSPTNDGMVWMMVDTSII